MSMTIPTLTGFPTTVANVGKTSNRGVELEVNFIPVQSKSGFTWESSFNAAWQKDQIEELAYGKNDMVDNAWFIGNSLSVYYGYENMGIWQDTAEDQAEMAKWNANGYSFIPGNVRPTAQSVYYLMDADDRSNRGDRYTRLTLDWYITCSFGSCTWRGGTIAVEMMQC